VGLPDVCSRNSLPLDWPVYVSHDEASAYARWAGKELPSEAEWHRAAYATRDGSERAYPWGAEPPSPRHGNFDLRRWDPVLSVNFPRGPAISALRPGSEMGGMDAHTLLSIPGFQPFSLLSWLLRGTFLMGHFVMKAVHPARRVHVAAVVSHWFQPHYPYI